MTPIFLIPAHQSTLGRNVAGILIYMNYWEILIKSISDVDAKGVSAENKRYEKQMRGSNDNGADRTIEYWLHLHFPNEEKWRKRLISISQIT